MREPNGIVWMGSPVQPGNGEEYLLHLLLHEKPRYAVGVWVDGEGFYDCVHLNDDNRYLLKEIWARKGVLLCSAEDYKHGCAFFSELPMSPPHMLPYPALKRTLEIMEHRAGLFIGMEAREMPEYYSGFDQSGQAYFKLWDAELQDYIQEFRSHGEPLTAEDHAALDARHAAFMAKMQAKSDSSEDDDDDDDPEIDEEEEEEERREQELLDAVRRDFEWEYLREPSSVRTLAEFARTSFLRFLKKLTAAMELYPSANCSGLPLLEYAECVKHLIAPETYLFIRKWFRPESYWLMRAGVQEEDLEDGDELMPEETCDFLDAETLGECPFCAILLLRLDRFIESVEQRNDASILECKLGLFVRDYLWWTADTRSKPE